MFTLDKPLRSVKLLCLNGSFLVLVLSSSHSVEVYAQPCIHGRTCGCVHYVTTVSTLAQSAMVSFLGTHAWEYNCHVICQIFLFFYVFLLHLFIWERVHTRRSKASLREPFLSFHHAGWNSGHPAWRQAPPPMEQDHQYLKSLLVGEGLF